MMSTKERSVFGLFKWRISAILVIYVSLPFAASQASSACYEHFQVDGQVSEGYGENVYVTKSDIPETLGVGELLYTLTWESGGSPNTSDSTTFMEYFEFDESETNTWKVKVKKSLEGLPDYPVSTVLMITNIEFSGYSQTCNVQLKHNLKDENTAPPQFDSPSYVVSIREDYPVELDIADLQIKVNDFDKDSPNNQFAVEVEGSQCPLKASQEKYTSVEGAQTLVLLWLTSELDYEEQKQLTCTLRAQDLGTPSLTTTADLTVNVENRQDEPPVFGYKFYYSTLESSLAGEVLDVKPEAILAENVEGTGVTYSMENARSDVNGLEYFAIDISTGAVSVTKDIEDSFLELERVSFILKAETTTSGGGADFSALEVTLPPVPTTTPPPTTTPTTTTPPPTTTPTVATCPACTCPTIESTSPWPTTTPATCPPCEPSTTEAVTCTPCATSTPCPTLPTGESTVAATECPTCAPSTLSSWLSTLASTASCPPCPTTAATGTTITPTTCPTTCPECPSTCPSTEGPTTCPECPTTYPSTETPTTCPECPTTCPSTETPTTCPECPTTYPSTDTPTTCPECPITCPSTETPTTCPECPTTCPSTETPTTCPECPTTCPSTETPTTCPDCPTSCPECPTSCPSTETPTTCPSVTCPSTDQPPGPTLTFKKASYAGEIFATTSRVWTVGVVEENADVTFSWEGGEDENFAIDAKTGEISSKKPELEIKEYGLTAVATAGELSDMAQVIIRVVEPLDAEVMIKNNLIRVEAEEGVEEQELAEIEAVGDVAEICVTDVTAPAAEGFFSVELVDGAWKLKAKSSLDYEETKQISFKLKARKEGDGDCSSSGFSDQLLRDEALVVVTVTDVNDAEPKFVVPATPQTVIAYPTDPALQKVVGPVITLQAEDEDSLPTYSLESAVDGLWVDEDTGAVYLQEENACGQECDVTARASDGEHSATAEIKVLSLDMDHIYSLTLDNVNVPDVDSELDSISAKAGVKISKVYVTPKIAETRTPSRAQRTPPAARRLGSSRWSGWESRVESWQLAVHVYAVEGEQLMALDQLNQKLTEGNTNHEASSFEERDAFDPPQPEGPSTVGYQVAVGILGALLGLLLIAAGFLAYRWQRGRSDRRRQEPKGISTVGGAYPNLSFNDEEDRTDSASQERKNGSLGGAGGGGGYKIDERRDSPPLFISSLSASKSEPPVSKSSEQQRGLRRVDPGKPEYYGMSSPTPPPSYSSNNAASSSSSSMYPNLSSSGAGPSSSSSSSAAKPSSSSSSSMYPSLPTPSYQSQKSVRKEPPPLGSAPAKSILRGTAPDTGQEVPLTLFSSGQEPSMPEKDYDEEVKTSAFSGLKKSPPPRRASTHALAEDAAAADRKEDSDQGEDDERRKSVAFKIMVDTKEIQPENEGPAQKKAAAKSDAMDILAANAKKMAEEGADDDSDDDVDEKF
ncbi:uncharacterized protein LOC125026297 isoform X2 [Penaeus chinensis]|uniref:uncharacterized protein LOC125026297 isoform X2 n=1 Tax=Penaeus chinensis TaxID=139456 RepID=UPI001FB5E4A5|nr:uncharacterized protein LOC125026297 isoform X2 [Penaeus chinensis]